MAHSHAVESGNAVPHCLVADQPCGAQSTIEE